MNITWGSKDFADVTEDLEMGTPPRIICWARHAGNVCPSKGAEAALTRRGEGSVASDAGRGVVWP